MHITTENRMIVSAVLYGIQSINQSINQLIKN